ncbi:MAG: tetratricopeptide repeat protein [Cyclobacteriaceae bacterium]|nr:tetratricopeptide repeat protein [Cyclobacteriaceae bacterium]
MKKTRVILLVVASGMVAILYFLPKAVVENDSQLQTETPAPDSATAAASPHRAAPKAIRNGINRLRARYLTGTSEEKNAIFADSLIGLYQQAGLYDSAAWFAQRADAFFKTKESLLKAGNATYEAYTFAVERDKQRSLAEKTRELFDKVLQLDPGNLEAKTKSAMTYLSSESPMTGIKMLREVVEQDPKNELALFNMGMLAVQSGQYGRAVDWFEKLLAVNPNHLQGNLLLGVAWMNQGEKEKARQQFEKVKKMDSDPAVQATVDSYLQELK